MKPVGVAVFQVSVTELILGFGTPFNLSLVNTLGVVVLVVVPLTVTTMLAVLHTVGLATAQIV